MGGAGPACFAVAVHADSAARRVVAILPDLGGLAARRVRASRLAQEPGLGDSAAAVAGMCCRFGVAPVAVRGRVPQGECPGDAAQVRRGEGCLILRVRDETVSAGVVGLGHCEAVLGADPLRGVGVAGRRDLDPACDPAVVVDGSGCRKAVSGCEQTPRDGTAVSAAFDPQCSSRRASAPDAFW